jgi:hypothetical protein
VAGFASVFSAGGLAAGAAFISIFCAGAGVIALFGAGFISLGIGFVAALFPTGMAGLVTVFLAL